VIVAARCKQGCPPAREGAGAGLLLYSGKRAGSVAQLGLTQLAKPAVG
jgi:hypothetical protein